MIFTYPVLLNFLNFKEHATSKSSSNDKTIFKKIKDESRTNYYFSKDRNSIYSVFKASDDETPYSNNFETFYDLLDYCQTEFKQDFRSLKIDEILED